MGTSARVCLASCALWLAACDEPEAAVAPAPPPVAPVAAVTAVPHAVEPVAAPPAPVLGAGMPPPGAVGTIGLGTIGTIGRGMGGPGLASSSSSVRTGEATLTGAGLSREVVRRVVRRHVVQVRGCYDAQLGHAPDLAGRVTVRWVIGVDGAVSDAALESSTLASAIADDGGASALAVGTCIVETVGTWSFPAPEGAPVHVSYPFVLESGPATDAVRGGGEASRPLSGEGLVPAGTGRGGS